MHTYCTSNMSSQFLIMCCRRVTNFSRESVETESWNGTGNVCGGKEGRRKPVTRLSESIQLASFPGQLPRNKAKCMFVHSIEDCEG